MSQFDPSDPRYSIGPEQPPVHVQPERGITAGSHVEAAFRLFDQLPFGVRSDLARLIYAYMHDTAGYDPAKVFASKDLRTGGGET